MARMAQMMGGAMAAAIAPSRPGGSTPAPPLGVDAAAQALARQGPPDRRQDVLLEERAAGSTRRSQPDEDAKAIVVTQLTDAYFQLARTQKAEYNQYLSQAEPVTVKLDGKVYHIDPAPAEPAR